MKSLPVVDARNGQQQPHTQDEAAPTDEPWIGPHGKRMGWLELHLTYTCPERCVFCSEAHRMERYKPYPVTWGRVARVLREQAERGVRRVHFTGGEPSIHPDFVRALALAKKLGMRTSVGTIGTMLRREDTAARALPLLDEVLFSLHGPDAAIHDGVTGRAGSFEQVTDAMRLARKLRPELGLYCNSVIVRPNAAQLDRTVALASSLGARLVVLSNLTPEGAGLDRYTELAVPLATLRVLVPRVVAAAGPETSLRFFGVPMCVLGEHRALSNDLHWDPRVTVEWTSAPGKVVFEGIYNWEPNRKRVHVDACEGCAARDVCAGVFDAYAEHFETPELQAQVRR